MCRLCLSRRAVLAAPALLPLALARGAAAAAEEPVEPRMRLANPPPDRLTVALTLDACPGAFDERIAAALVESAIPATIFVTELWLRRNPAGAAFLLAHRDLFGIENHGERHIPPVLGERSIFGIPVAGDLATVRREVIEGATAVTATTAAASRWYRAATGYYSPSAMVAIQDLGFAIAGYSLNADIGASLPARAVADRIAGATSGEIIVAHINQPERPSGAGVVAGMRELQRRGASFLRLDQLAAANLVSL
ncbi:MAG TPA: polysaccharide deacetylase family protein [Stellaceae bacterium]|nr:polysaccharide deacetylase family protein [Stellaceae bacterium]